MKRTLAILVAAVLFLGMFAVAANAAVTPRLFSAVGDAGSGLWPDTLALAGFSDQPYLVRAFDLNAKIETEVDISTLASIETGKKLEARVETTAAFDGFAVGKYPTLEDFEANNVKLLWYLSDDTGAFNFGKAGIKSDTFEVKAADIGKYIALMLVFSKDNIAENDPVPATGFDDYFQVSVIGPITGMLFGTAQAYADTVVQPLVKAKVINIELITGLGTPTWVAETIAPFSALDSYVDALNKAYRAAIKAGDDFADWMSVNTPTPAQRLVQERKVFAANEALYKAAQALEDAANALADDILNNAAKVVDDYIALLEGWDTTNVSLEDQARMVRAISAAKVVKFNIVQLRRVLDASYDAEERIKIAGQAAAATETLDRELLNNLLKNKPEMTDAEKKALEDKIKELEDALKDLIDNPVIITPPPVKIVAIDAIYDFFAGLIGGNFFTNVLSWITRYVLFGWLWSPIKYVLA